MDTGTQLFLFGFVGVGALFTVISSEKEKRTHRLISSHIETLSKIKSRLVFRDMSGNYNSSFWKIDVDHFANTILMINTEDNKVRESIYRRIDGAVSRYQDGTLKIGDKDVAIDDGGSCGVIKYNGGPYSSMYEAMIGIASKHIDTFLRKRKQLMYVDDYGNTISVAWYNEIESFMRNTFGKVDGDVKEFMFSVINMYVSAHDCNTPHINEYRPDFSGIEYEAYCENLIKQAGWQTSRTKVTGDQGADIIAKRNGCVMVVQCKHYGKPIGNAAVQEVIAAKAYYEATLGMVMTNSDYTVSARQLAGSAGVLLAHHDAVAEELKNLQH